MDNASAYGAEDCRFESCRGRKSFGGRLSRIHYKPSSGPVILSSYQYHHIFQLWVALPISGVVLAFLIGYIVHTDLMYSYKWGCKTVYLPSVSRVLNLHTERIAWNLMSLASIPLQFFVIIRQYVLTYSASKLLQYLRYVLVISAIFQSIFLSLLATVGEREDGNYHVAFFCGFSVSTMINYVVFTILMKFTSKEDPKYGKRRMKILLGLMITLPIIFVSFIAHNVFCITGAYESFAIFEYLTIILIFAFNFFNSYLYSHPSQKVLICYDNGIISPIKL